MQECKRCGQIRPDSQTTCDCSAPERRFDLPPAASWSTAALVATIGGEVTVLSIARTSNQGLGAIGLAVLGLLVGFACILVNAVAGMAAHRRGEAWGGPIAVLGIVLLAATMILAFVH